MPMLSISDSQAPWSGATILRRLLDRVCEKNEEARPWLSVVRQRFMYTSNGRPLNRSSTATFVLIVLFLKVLISL